MNIPQLFVTKRPIAWTAMISVLVWGVYAYLMMPQRQDPIIPVVTGVILTPYPGAEAERVEQEVTRKIERRVAENPAVDHVKSISRPGMSIVYVELFETERNAELVWQDVRGKLGEIKDLPAAAGKPTQSLLNKDFGDSVAVMLTISSPPVSDLEIQLRAQGIRRALESHRQEQVRPATTMPEGEQWTAVLVYPGTVSRSHVVRLGRTLAQSLTEAGVARDVAIVEAPSAGMLEVMLDPGKTSADLQKQVARWERENVGADELDPDVWRPFWVEDLSALEGELRRNARDKYSYRELKDFADRIRDRLKQSHYVAQIDLIGNQEEKVWLSYSGHRLNQFGITPLSIIDRVQERNINIPGGRVELPDQNVVVRPTGEYTTADEIGHTVMDVSSDGYPLYLRDLVEVRRGYEDPANTMNFRTIKVPRGDRLPAASPESEGEGAVPEDYELQTGRAITLSVRQVKGTNIADYDRDMNAAIAELKQLLPSDLRMERTSNEPQKVRDKIHGFNKNLIEAIVIVVLVSLVFMEWRSALLVAIAIPITIAMTLGMSQLVGIDLQQVSIAALIIALGLLVDAPVVAADAINRELANGHPRHIASWLGPKHLAHAVFYATLTNIVAFLPLLLVKGKTGDFIYSLPIVVSWSLFAAMLVAWTFCPLLGFYMLKGQKSLGAADGGKPAGGFPRLYKAFVENCIEHRLRTAAVSLVVLLAGALVCWRTIGTSFFPKDLHSVFTVNLDLPEGSPIRQTREVAMEAIRKIDALEGERIRSYTTFVGAGGPRFWLSIEPEQRADNYAQILVHTASKEETAEIVARLKEELPLQIAESRVRTQMLETGPPIGIPVQLRLFGDDIQTLRELAAQVKARMRAIPGTLDINDDWGDPSFQMTLKVNSDRAALSGVTNQDVATTVGTGLSGTSISQLRERDRLIGIAMRLRPSERSELDDLNSLYVASSSMDVRVPLSQIASFERQMITPKVRRRDHERCITVRCDVVNGVLPSTVVSQLLKMLPAQASMTSAGGADAGQGTLAFPVGYKWEFGGEKFEQDKGFRSLAIALLVSFAAIYLALVVQFNSVTQPLLVYAAVPFGVVGGLLGLAVMGASFGFMAFLGVASLAGLIISHVIVLFDFIEEMKHKGEALRHAVVDAGLARLRPVLTTVLACVGGLIPLAMDGGPLWEPMCYVQIAGMLVATLVTLVIVPVLYVIFVEDLHLVRWQTESNALQEHQPSTAQARPLATTASS